MANNMNLTPQDVYEKEFHVDLKGYAPAEVDEFLDQVIEDYQVYDDKIEELGQAIARYENKIKELQQEVFKAVRENNQLKEKMKSGFVDVNSDQLDLLKRIARLEAAVFGQTNEE